MHIPLYIYIYCYIWFHVSQDEFLQMIEDSGFVRGSYTNFTGGIVAVHSAFKPWQL